MFVHVKQSIVHTLQSFSPELAILADSSGLHVQHVFRKACRSTDFFCGFFGFSLLLSSQLPSIRSNLTVGGNILDSGRLQVHSYQIVDLFTCYISFIVRFIISMLYIDNIYLADDLIYIYVYCTCQQKNQLQPMSFTVRNSRFLCVSAIQSPFTSGYS